MRADPNIGLTLANRYQLEALIGRGAMGRVYRAKHVLLDAPVAVKFLAQTLLNQKMQVRFKREARACFLLGQKSKHIVQVLDYGVSEEEIPFYVMEYLEGFDLGAILRRQSLPLPRFLNLTHQVCLGLQAAHQGIVLENRLCPIIHRDIKPSNLLVIDNPDKGEIVKILDFGIAKLLQEDQGQTSHFMGTLAYSAPEQMEGAELDSRADIYSLGVVMYEMLTGKMPIQADTHSFGSWYKAHHDHPPRPMALVNPKVRVPKPLEALVLQCLAKKPHDRPRSISDILTTLEPLEQRYRPGQKIGQQIESVLARSNTDASEDGRFASNSAAQNRAPVDPDTLCRLQSWPLNKPTAEIVFPHLLPTSHNALATVWVMLPLETIHALQKSDRNTSLYHRFMGSLSPHPMVLWLTAIYVQHEDGAYRPKWLPCYLDLKQSRGLKLAQVLSSSGEYRLLFFALENPQKCTYVTKVRLSEDRRQILQSWADKSENLPSTQASLSKNHLKQELGRIKDQILQQMKSSNVSQSV